MFVRCFLRRVGGVAKNIRRPNNRYSTEGPQSVQRSQEVTADNGNVAMDNGDVTVRDVPPELMPVVTGLTSKPRRIPYWYMYDKKGSEIYEEVVTTSKTYLNWRKELSVLQRHSDDIAAKTSSPVTLMELGSGASSKTRLVIQALLKRHGTLTFIPVDVSKDHIEEVGEQLERDYSGLRVRPFGGLYMEGVQHLSSLQGPRMLLFLGGSFGNIPLDEQLGMMREIRTQLTTKDRFVMGLDMNHNRESLLEAYGKQWTTNVKDNAISRLNKDFDGNMDAEKFELITDFIKNPAEGDTPSYVVGHWKSLEAHSANFRKLGLTLDFRSGEKFFFTDGPNWSCKWSLHQVRRLAERSGFALEDYWTSEEADYGMVCFAPVA